jgi:hypothetical protein
MMHGQLCRCGGVKQWLVRLWPSSPPLGGPDHCFTTEHCQGGPQDVSWVEGSYQHDARSTLQMWSRETVVGLTLALLSPPWEVQTTISLLSTVKEAQQM